MHLLRVRVHVFYGACVVFALRVVAALAVHVCVVYACVCIVACVHVWQFFRRIVVWLHCIIVE